MVHHGTRLKAIAKSKGFDAQSLAKRIKVIPLTVETDFKRENLTRRVLSKYTDVLKFDIDNFYEENVSKPESIESIDLVSELHHKEQLLATKDKIIADKEETILEQRKHIDTLNRMLRFFPSAAQPVIITA